MRNDKIIAQRTFKRVVGGAETWPELVPLIALHLSDDDGQPSHVAANGWYWMAGALGGMGERYHGGSGDQYSAKSPIDCLTIFADYVRISMADAVRLANEIAQLRASGDEIRAGRLFRLRREYGQHIRLEDFREYTDVGQWLRAPAYSDKTAREWLNAWIEAQRPRWAAEAAAGLAWLQQAT